MQNTKTLKFIEKSKEIHSDRYDYSLVEYVNNSTKVKIICLEHGEFESIPKSHLKGAGCPICSGAQFTTDYFIQRATEAHSGKYDYSLVNYVNSLVKVKIICPEHGVFEQIPREHLKGSGCPACAGVKKHTNETFILKAKEIHGYKYDYSLVEYNGNKTKVKIICPEHGVFLQSPNKHLSGNDCPVCAGSLIEIVDDINIAIAKEQLSTEIFIERAKNVHGEKYDYSLAEYINFATKVKIICSGHGVFEQRPSSHLSGSGCPICFGTVRHTNESFTTKAKEIHVDRYDYSLVEYVNSLTKVEIICLEHGVFEQRPNDHLSGNGCRKCSSEYSISSQEIEIYEYIKSIYSGEVIQSYRPEWLDGKELDLFIPEFNFAIEFNGTYWHSEDQKDKWYHFDKTKKCIDNGIILLHVWEFKWNIPEKQNIYKSIIRHHLKMDKKIPARKCKIVDLDIKTVSNFISLNHIEGFSGFPYKDSIPIGLTYDNKIVMVALVGKYFVQKQNVFKWKLQRICTSLDVTVVGGISKLSREIERRVGNFSYQIAIDTGGSTLRGKSIERKDVSLRYWWVKGNEIRTRNSTQTHLLKKNEDWVEGDSESFYMQKNGYIKIYDSGIYNFL